MQKLDSYDFHQLELCENSLGGKELKICTKYKKLKTLKFAGNEVKDFKELECLVLLIYILTSCFRKG